MVGKYIQDQLDDLEEFGEDDDEDVPEDYEKDLPSDLEEVGNVVVGAKRRAVSFIDLENSMQKDTAFYNFRIRFADFLSDFLPAFGHPLPGGRRVKFHPQQEVSRPFTQGGGTQPGADYSLRIHEGLFQIVGQLGRRYRLPSLQSIIPQPGAI